MQAHSIATGAGHVDRLRRIRALLTTQNRFGAETAKLVCYSGAGFSDQLRAQAVEDRDLVLIGIDDLYQPTSPA